MSVQQNIDDYYLAGVKTYGTKEETKKAKKRARKQGLWGRIGGSALGALTSFALSGGAINPMTLALLTAGGTRLGSAIGSKMAGGLGSDYEWIQEEVDDMKDLLKSQRDSDAFKAGLFQGLGQLSKLAKNKKDATGLFDLGDTRIGKYMAKNQMLGTDAFVNTVREQAFEDNPWLREEHLEDALDAPSMKAPDFRMGDATGKYTLGRYGMEAPNPEISKMYSGEAIPGMSDQGMATLFEDTAIKALDQLGDRPSVGSVPYDSYHDIVADYDQSRRDALEMRRFSRYLEDPTRRAFNYEFGGE